MHIYAITSYEPWNELKWTELIRIQQYTYRDGKTLSNYTKDDQLSST
jgi:hypothetical protein